MHAKPQAAGSRGFRGFRGGRGFTLLELVLVMFVAALMLAMALPALRPFLAAREASGAAGELVAMTRLARSLAVSEARVYRLHVDETEGEFWLSHDELEEGEALPVPVARPMELPRDVTAVWHASASTQMRGYVRFYPNGRCDPTTFELAGARGEPVFVASRAMHEAYAIRSAEAVGGTGEVW
ncbi:MAG: GspH/FimT family pseudopilin [Phycisphaeraceae bacterium]